MVVTKGVEYYFKFDIYCESCIAMDAKWKSTKNRTVQRCIPSKVIRTIRRNSIFSLTKIKV